MTDDDDVRVGGAVEAVEAFEAFATFTNFMHTIRVHEHTKEAPGAWGLAGRRKLIYPRRNALSEKALFEMRLSTPSAHTPARAR